jgi:hypothetical protein
MWRASVVLSGKPGLYIVCASDINLIGLTDAPEDVHTGHYLDYREHRNENGLRATAPAQAL